MKTGVVLCLLFTCAATLRADLCVHQGSFETPGSNGNYIVDQLSCQPKLILFTYSRGPDDSMVGGNNQYGFGAAVSPSAQFTVFGADGSSSNSTWARHDNSKVIYSALNTGAGLNVASLTAINSDGFTLNFSSVSSSYSQTVKWIALGGSDVDGASILQYQYDGENPKRLTGAGFAPDAVIFVTAGLADNPPYSSTNINYAQAIGIATRLQGAQGAYSIWSNYTSEVRRRAQTYDVTDSTYRRAIFVAGDSSIQASAYVSVWDSNGVTLTWDVAPPANWYFWAIYIKGPQFHLTQFLNPSSTGTTQVTGASFTPSAFLTYGFCNPGSTGVVSNAFMTRGYTIGSSAQGFNFGGRLTGSSGSGSAKYSTHLTGCYSVASGGTVSEQVRGAFSQWVTGSGTGNGVEIYWTVTNTTQRQFIGLMIGPAAPPAERTVSPLLISHRRFP